MSSLGASGHQRIPSSGISFIAQQIELIIERIPRPLTGVCSLAAGADQLFAVAVLKAQGELRVVIPSKDYERTFSEASDRQSYEELLGLASCTEVLPFDEPTQEAFLAAGRRVVDLSDAVVAIWDGEIARGLGGTADIVSYARQKGTEVHVVWPPGLKR